MLDYLSLKSIDLSALPKSLLQMGAVTEVRLSYPCIAHAPGILIVNPGYNLVQDDVYACSHCDGDNITIAISKDVAVTLPIGHFTVEQMIPLSKVQITLSRGFSTAETPSYYQFVTDNQYRLCDAQKVGSNKVLSHQIGTREMKVLGLCRNRSGLFFVCQMPTEKKLADNTQLVLFITVEQAQITYYEFSMAEA